MPKLNKTAVDSLKPKRNGDAWRWCSMLTGFGVRCTPAGVKSFVVRYGTGKRGGGQRVTIGRYGRWTVEQAREEAAHILRAVDAGRDPAAERRTARELPTVHQLGERFIEEHAEVRKAPRSADEDRSMLERVINPSPLGRLRVDRVTDADVLRLHHARRKTPTDANRMLALLGKMFALSETWGLRPRNSNPVHGIQKFEEGQREDRYLSDAELARLGDALRDGGEDPYAVAAIRLLVLTGARRSEILNAKWSDVDFEEGILRVARPKEKKPKRIRLAPPALTVLDELPREKGNPYVIAGRREGRPFIGLTKVWERIRAAAGLDDVRIHDLRHTHASVAVAGGASLPVIGALLGHRQTSTTQRYAHLSDDALKPTADAVASRIDSAMSGTKKKAPIPIRRRR